MHFVKTDKLTIGMRMARPLYTKRGDIIFPADSKIDERLLNYIKDGNLIGIYVLEPSENFVPFSEEEGELLKFQYLEGLALQKEIEEAVATHRLRRLEYITDEIIEKYGNLRKRIRFIQDMRTPDNYVYMHSVNVAIISAVVSGRMGLTMEQKRTAVTASLIHDLGKTLIPKKLLEGETEEELIRILDNSQDTGFDLINTLFPENPDIKKISVQAHKILKNLRFRREVEKERVTYEASVLILAETFDQMSAMSMTGTVDNNSYVKVLKYFLDNPNVFDKRAVKAFSEMIEILPNGASVLLSNGRQALVISENKDQVLLPTVLEFGSNRMLDLSNRELCGDIEIVDAVKKTDTRYTFG